MEETFIFRDTTYIDNCECWHTGKSYLLLFIRICIGVKEVNMRKAFYGLIIIFSFICTPLMADDYETNATVKVEDPDFGVMFSRPKKIHLFSNKVRLNKKGYYLRKGSRVRLLKENYITLFRRWHYGKILYKNDQNKVEEGWVRIGEPGEKWYYIVPDNPDNPYNGASISQPSYSKKFAVQFEKQFLLTAFASESQIQKKTKNEHSDTAEIIKTGSPGNYVEVLKKFPIEEMRFFLGAVTGWTGIIALLVGIHKGLIILINSIMTRLQIAQQRFSGTISTLILGSFCAIITILS